MRFLRLGDHWLMICIFLTGPQGMYELILGIGLFDVSLAFGVSI